MSSCNVGKNNPNWRGGKIERKCETCGKTFYKNLSQILYGKARFCSRRCSNLGKNNPMFGKKHSKERKAMMSKRMAGENNPMYGKVPTRMVGKDNPMYGRNGEKNPNWMGGRSFFPYPIQWTNNLRENIKKRDGYKCQECGILERDCDRRLSVHHIDCDKKNLNEDNLISLCLSCHSKEHNKIRREFKACISLV